MTSKLRIATATLAAVLSVSVAAAPAAQADKGIKGTKRPVAVGTLPDIDAGLKWRSPLTDLRL